MQIVRCFESTQGHFNAVETNSFTFKNVESIHWNICYSVSFKYLKTSNIKRALVGNKIVDHSDVVGASPVGAAPITSSFSTWYLALRDSTKKAARQYENLLSVGFDASNIRDLTVVHQYIDSIYRNMSQEMPSYLPWFAMRISIFLIQRNLSITTT